MANDHFDSRIPMDYTKGPFDLYRDVVVFQNISTMDPISNWRNQVEMIYFSALIRSLLSRISELTSRVRPESRVRLPGFGNFVDYPIKKKDLRWFGSLVLAGLEIQDARDVVRHHAVRWD